MKNKKALFIIDMQKSFSHIGNMPEFFAAFEVVEGDAIRQPADQITKIR